MQLDGDNVRNGDLVFDILLGISGTVTAVNGANFTLSFGNGRRLTYHGNGNVANVKRAYWRNPVITVPRRNDAQWPLLTALVDTVRSQP